MPGDSSPRQWARRPRKKSDDTNSNFHVTSIVQTTALFSSLWPNQSHQNTRVDKNDRNRRNPDADGSANPNSRDPPGQSSVYVAPGDHRNECYRLATFEKWPLGLPVTVNNLAASGFYYTGFKDRTKCFSCGMTVENWSIGDDVFDPQWHKNGCRMANGGDETNIASHLTKMTNFCRNLSNAPELRSEISSHYKPQQNIPNSSHQVREFQEVYNFGHPNVNVADALMATDHQPRFPPLGFGEIQAQEHELFLRSLNLVRESDRRKTFSKWPSYPAPELPSKLAAEGFFYLGNLDRVQCFRCSGVLRNWAKNDTPRTEHEKHFPNCRIVQNDGTYNIPMPAAERHRLDEQERHRRAALQQVYPVAPGDPSPAEQRFLAEKYPCFHPVNPHMETLEARIASFNSLWPTHRMKATPMDIAKAGFFYLGQADKAKCFYCNGGLQNWDENDEPWSEHATWFPGCEFVLRMRGVPFVRNLAEANPNLARPAIRNPVSYNIEYPPSFPSLESATASPTSSVPGTTERDTLNQMCLCRKCNRNTADNVAQPCGHLALCSGCSAYVKFCIICKKPIDSTIKVYRA